MTEASEFYRTNYFAILERETFIAANTDIPTDVREKAAQLCENLHIGDWDRDIDADCRALEIEMDSHTGAAALARLAIWYTDDNLWSTAATLIRNGWTP